MITKEFLEEELKNGLTIKQIATKLDVNNNTLTRYIKLYNIKKQPIKKYTLDENFFANPNILNSYWAGFIAADGCLFDKKNKSSRILSICLNVKDEKHLNSFRENIKYTGPITYTIGKSNNKICWLRIYSHNVYNDLIEKFNITPRKTFTLEPPIGLSNICVLAYICGFIDGDGSVTYTKNSNIMINMIGPFSFLSWIKNTLEELIPLKWKIGRTSFTNKTNGNIYHYLQIYNIDDIYNICKRIDQLEIPKLNRKWDRIKEILNVETADGDTN